MSSSKLTLTSLVLALALSACASKPKPAPAGPPEPPAAANELPSEPAPQFGQVNEGLQAQLAAEAGDRVYFELDSHGLTDDARRTLDRQATWIASHPGVRLTVAGNCDERGTQAYNIALGQRRANAARDFLVAKGVAAGRITTISYGKDRPTALGSNEQAWSQNRNAITSVR